MSAAAEQGDWMVGLLLLGLGGSATGVAWWLMTRIAAVPPLDRSFRDRPPLAFRCVWWPIQWLAHDLGEVLPQGYAKRVQGRLRWSGLDYALSVQEFVAASLLYALASAGCVLWLNVKLGWSGYGGVLASAMAGYGLPWVWLGDLIKLRRRDTLKTLPFFLDMVTLCVEAGLNLTGAMTQAVLRGPSGPLRDEFSRVLRDVRTGKSRADALRSFSDRMNEASITHLVSALIQAEAMGMTLGPILRAQAEQRRAERFARAEKLAMEAPVKLLLPLIGFIFPCTFVVLGFPIAVKFMQVGF
jgi:tight adherence protein C